MHLLLNQLKVMAVHGTMADATKETEHVLRLTCIHEQDQKPPKSLVTLQPIKQYCHYLIFLFQKRDQVSSVMACLP